MLTPSTSIKLVGAKLNLIHFSDDFETSLTIPGSMSSDWSNVESP